MVYANILQSPAFLPPSECRRIIERFEQLAETPLAHKYTARVEVNGRCMADLLTGLRAAASTMVTHVFGLPEELFIDYTLVSKMLPGDYNLLHADNATVDRTAARRSHTAMIYLNESSRDFQGGNLRFPEWDIEIAPKAGLLTAFPCGGSHKHTVFHIKAGARYAIAMWFTDDPAHRELWP